MNDRLDQAFAALDARGILALHDAGLTQSDGWDDVRDLHETERPEARGAVFYTGQDAAWAHRGQGLVFAFGALASKPSKKADALSVAIGREIREVLASYGVETTWSGEPGDRISTPPFAWQKRRFTKAPRVTPTEAPVVAKKPAKQPAKQPAKKPAKRASKTAK